MIEPAALIASADEIDNRLGPIPGRSADRIARELRAAAQAMTPKPSRDLLDVLMEVYADAVNNGDGYLGRAQLEYTLMKHDLCLIDARDCPTPSVLRPQQSSEAK